MNKFKLLIGLIVLDIVLTIYAVKYLGAIELNPLCYNFDQFMIIKILLSSICLIGIYFLKYDKYVKKSLSFLIFFYIWVGINNLWQTANYIYY